MCPVCVRSHTDTHSHSHTHIHTMACPGSPRVFLRVRPGVWVWTGAVWVWSGARVGGWVGFEGVRFVRFVCLSRVCPGSPRCLFTGTWSECLCASVCPVCPVSVPAPPVSFYRYLFAVVQRRRPLGVAALLSRRKARRRPTHDVCAPVHERLRVRLPAPHRHRKVRSSARLICRA